MALRAPSDGWQLRGPVGGQPEVAQNLSGKALAAGLRAEPLVRTGSWRLAAHEYDVSRIDCGREARPAWFPATASPVLALACSVCLFTSDSDRTYLKFRKSVRRSCCQVCKRTNRKSDCPWLKTRVWLDKLSRFQRLFFTGFPAAQRYPTVLNSFSSGLLGTSEISGH